MLLSLRYTVYCVKITKGGNILNKIFKEKVLEAMMSVLPVAAIVLALSVILVPLDVGNMMIFLLTFECHH